MSNMKTLKLDSSYRPLAVIDSVEALVLCLIGKARAIESYTKKINSVRKSFDLPAVIVLNRYIKFRFVEELKDILFKPSLFCIILVLT